MFAERFEYGLRLDVLGLSQREEQHDSALALLQAAKIPPMQFSEFAGTRASTCGTAQLRVAYLAAGEVRRTWPSNEVSPQPPCSPG
jgi:hypothetical protein